MPEAITLAPCPFCGGVATFIRKGTVRQSCIVECMNCGCRLETGEVCNCGFAWNTRWSADRALTE